VTAERSGTTVICRVHREFLDQTPPAALKARGELTKAQAVARGLGTVLVIALEDGKLEWHF
jgi:hypothetical protein